MSEPIAQQIDSMRIQVIESNARAARAERAITTHEQTIARQQEEIGRVTREEGALLTELSEQKFAADNAERRLASVSAELAKTREQLASKVEEVEALNGKLTAAILGSKEEVDSLAAQLSEAKQVEQHLTNALRETNQECENRGDIIDRLNAQVTAAEAERDAAKADSERLDWLARETYWPHDHPEKGIFVCVSEEYAPHGYFTLEWENDKKALREAIDAAKSK